MTIMKILFVIMVANEGLSNLVEISWKINHRFMKINNTKKVIMNMMLSITTRYGNNTNNA